MSTTPSMGLSGVCENQKSCLGSLLEKQDFEMLSRYLLVAPPEILDVKERLALFKALWIHPVALRRYLQRYAFPQAFQGLQDVEALKLQFYQAEINPDINPELLEAFRQIQNQFDSADSLIQDLRLFWTYWLGQSIQAHNLTEFKILLVASDYQNWEPTQKIELKAQALQALNIDAFELLGGKIGDPIVEQKQSWQPFINRNWRGELSILDYWLEQASLNDDELQTLLRIVSGNNPFRRHHPEAIQKLLQAGQSFTQQDERGVSAMHYYLASVGASWTFLTKSVDLSSQINHFDENGNSLLMYAARGGNMDIIQGLLNEGLSPQLRSSQQESSHSILLNAPVGSSVLTQSLGNRRLDAFHFFSQILDIYAEPRNLLAMSLLRISMPNPENYLQRQREIKTLLPTLRLLAEAYPVDQEAWDQLVLRQCLSCVPLFIQQSDYSKTEILKRITQSTQLLLDEKAYLELEFYLKLIQIIEEGYAASEPLAVLSLNQALNNLLKTAEQQKHLLATASEIKVFFQALRSQELRLLNRLKDS